MNVKRIPAAAGGYPFAVASVALCTLALLPFRALLPAATVMLLYVPVISLVARLCGVRPSATAALLSFVALDLVFIPPYYRLTVASMAEWLALVVFLIVALVAGQQTALLRRRERVALRRQRELELLNSLSFRITAEKSVRSAGEYVVGQLTEALGAERAAVYIGSWDSATPVCIAQAGDPKASSGESALVAWALRNGKAIGALAGRPAGGEMLPIAVGPAEAIAGVVADGLYLPLRTADSLEGVLYARTAQGTDRETTEPGLLVAIANLVAVSFERQRLEEEAARATALAEADRLKTTLVSSLSHELKTPLAAATARVTGLLDESERSSEERVRDELTAVAEDLSRLDMSIGDLLDLSRLESDAWRPRFEMQEVADVLGTVRSRLTGEQQARVSFSLAPDLPPICGDFAQLTRALTNLVENALAYSPPESDVVVGARRDRDTLQLWVEDRGPGVPDGEKDAVFDKFFRGSASAPVPGGTGLGLAIAREIVRSHHGSLWVEDAEPQGARFVMSLPLAECRDEG